jgi:hypothetical protein
MAAEERESGIWRPARSSGTRWGLVLLGATLVGVATAGVAALNAAATPARVGALFLCLALVSCAGVIALVLTQIATMRYVLGANAVEIRTAVGRSRIRYEQIDKVRVHPDEEGEGPLAWPGVYLGCLHAAGWRAEWHATTLAAGRVVWIQCGNSISAISPADPIGFQERLGQLASETAHLPVGAASTRCPPLAYLLKLDPWFRLAVLSGLVTGALVAWREVAANGSVQPGTLIAVVALAVNAGVGAAVARYSAGASRMLAAGALAAVLVAGVW